MLPEVPTYAQLPHLAPTAVAAHDQAARMPPSESN